MKTQKMPRKWLYLLIALIILSPIGILLVWNYGDAWGEWGEVGDWIPKSFWNAPFPDYLSGFESQLAASIGYIISAIIGVVAIILVTYGIGILIANREKKKQSTK